MKIVYLTRGDFIHNRKEGGLSCRYRNYRLLCNIVGEENLRAYIITEEKAIKEKNVTYIFENNNVLHRYFNYLLFRDGYSKKCEKKIVEILNTENPDLVFYDGSTWGKILLKSKKNSITFFHNIERQYTWERVKYGNVFCFFRYFANRICEKWQVKETNKIICLNERDNDLLDFFYKRKADLILPITFQDEFSEKILFTIEERYILFVGSYFEANVKGIKWFIDNVMPFISYKLFVVGKGMEKLKWINSDHIEIVGTVEKIAPYYQNAEGVIMPIFFGGGMKVKTAEAMMYGKTIFATKEALEGYDISNVEGVYRCDNAKTFINKLNLYYESNKGYKFRQEIRNLFLNKYEDTSKILDLKKF